MPRCGDSQFEGELALRLEAMRWLDGRDGELVRSHELTGFEFAGGRIALLDRQRGSASRPA